MGVGTHRLFRWRTWGLDDDLAPEPGDRDIVEPWCNGGHPDREGGIPEGMLCRVLHYRIGTVRVPVDERPDDAMTWYAGPPDKRAHHH